MGQNITIDTLILPKIESIKNPKIDRLKFPIIKTGNLEVDNTINKDLKNRFTNHEFSDLPIDSTLIKWAGEQIIYLDFETTYIKNGLISLNISAEGCGANCTASTDYFTYNYITGQFVAIDQIIDTTGRFTDLVIAEKDKQYEQSTLELKKMLISKTAEVDQDTYDRALAEYESCRKEFTIKTFALHADYLEIIYDCFLPRAINNLKPNVSLKYKYVDVKKYLKIIY